MPILISPEITVNSNTTGDQTGPFVSMLADGSLMFSWTTLSETDGLSRVAYRAFDKDLSASAVDGFLQTSTVGIDDNTAAGVIGLESDLFGNTAALLFKTSNGYSGGALSYVGGPRPAGGESYVGGGLIGSAPSSMVDFGYPLIVQVWNNGTDGFDVGYRSIDGTETVSNFMYPVNTTLVGDQIDPSATYSHSGLFFSWTSQLLPSGGDSGN